MRPRWPFRKKRKWEKVACTFELLENLPGGTSGGWATITQASGEIPTKEEASEFFKPGRHYRVMARAVEDDDKAGIKAGTYAGVVWKHYEPLPGGVVKEKLKLRAERKTAPADPSKIMGEWAEGLKKQIEPIKTFAEAIGELGDAFAAIRGDSAGVEGPPAAAGPEYTISALNYEGKAPWYFHPQIITSMGDQIKSVIDYGANRLEGIIGKGAAPPTEEEEEEEFRLPSLLEEAAEEAIEEAPIEEVAEEEVEVPIEEAPVEEVMPAEEVIEEEAAEVPIEETTEEAGAEAPLEEVETIPSLLEEGIPCAQCGRTDVPLLPSGVCKKCAKAIAQKETVK
ncbi:hypothetical protein ES703_100133 [subsurface metagenome]